MKPYHLRHFIFFIMLFGCINLNANTYDYYQHESPDDYLAPDYPTYNQAMPSTPPMPDKYVDYPYYGSPYPPTDYAYPPQFGKKNRGFGNFNNFGNFDDNFFGGNSPLTNPMDHNGYWANPRFRPWRSGPFERDRWDNHPMSNMPWGNFPGWGDGFFGGFGPDDWRGATPWGNNVPFRWIDPTEPKDSIANMWDDAINTPNSMGRMPPGWTAPYISIPNPVDVADEFERNARNFPDEARKMIEFGEGSTRPRKRDSSEQESSSDE